MKRIILLVIVLSGLTGLCYAGWGIGANSEGISIRTNWNSSWSSEVVISSFADTGFFYSNTPSPLAGADTNTTNIALKIAPVNYALFSDDRVRVNTGLQFTPDITFDKVNTANGGYTSLLTIHTYMLSILMPEIDFRVVGGIHFIATTALSFAWSYNDIGKVQSFSIGGTLPVLFNGIGLIYYFE
jgi:hypothetical protein